MTARLALVESLIEEYPDLPLEVVFKEDLLRTGISFTEDALRVAAGFKPKAYFIFSFDLVPISEMQQQENVRAPEEICLQGGPRNFRRTIVSVRVNPKSPYQIKICAQGKVILSLEGEEIAEVHFQRNPEYYGRSLANGKPISDIAPSIEWGYLLYLTVFRICQYFGQKEECQFCDLNENYRQQKTSGRSYTAVKSVEEVLEALEIIHETDSESQAYTVTGGSITSTLGENAKSISIFNILQPLRSGFRIDGLERLWCRPYHATRCVDSRRQGYAFTIPITKCGMSVFLELSARERIDTSGETSGSVVFWMPPRSSVILRSSPILWPGLRQHVPMVLSPLMKRLLQPARVWTFSCRRE